MRSGDAWIVLLLLVVLALWGFRGFRRWLMAPPNLRLLIRPDAEIPVTDAVALLEREGYEVLTQKRKIGIKIRMNDQDTMYSSLFVDHFAQDDAGVYVVRVARERKPLSIAGSPVRDALMPYALLYPETAGVLYVDPKQDCIYKFQFETDNTEP